MTIASVTFSITVVALQLASSQFGPRLLRNFMRDRGNQIAIGTFIATFTYCLLVLRTVNGTEGEEFVPHIAVTFGLVLALFSLGVFIYFIHHSAESIQVENVISSVSRDLHDAIDRLYPECLGQEKSESEVSPGDKALPATFESEARSISAARSDYLQAIDVDRLLSLAKESDMVFSVSQRPGKFFIKGLDLRGHGRANVSTTSWPTRFGERFTLAAVALWAKILNLPLSSSSKLPCAPVARRERSVHGNDLRRTVGSGGFVPWLKNRFPHRIATTTKANCESSPMSQQLQESLTHHSIRSGRPLAKTRR